MKTILVEFDNDNVGCEAKCRSLYIYSNHNAVPIEKVQVTFPVNREKQSCRQQGNSSHSHWLGLSQFTNTRDSHYLKLWWNTNKGNICSLGKHRSLSAEYVPHEKLHIINYTHAQIRISSNIEMGVQSLRTNMLPEMPQCLFDVNPTALCLLAT